MSSEAILSQGDKGEVTKPQSTPTPPDCLHVVEFERICGHAVTGLTFTFALAASGSGTEGLLRVSHHPRALAKPTSRSGKVSRFKLRLPLPVPRHITLIPDDRNLTVTLLVFPL